MATFVVSTMNRIDAGVATYAETVFNSVGPPILLTLQSCGVLALMLIALNSVLNFRPVQVSEYINWGIKYIIILTVATSWAHFIFIYNIITEVPGQYGALLLQSSRFSGAAAAGGVDLNINSSIDFFVSDVFRLSDVFTRRGGLFNLGAVIVGLVLKVLAIIMVVIAIIVLAVGKIGLAMAISFAPFFIGTLIFKQTSKFFEVWSQFTMGFAMIPMVIAGLMGILLGVGTALLDVEPNPRSLGAAAPFLVLLIAALVLMGQIPTMVQSLSGSVVAMASAATAQAGFNKILGAGNAAKGAVARVTAGSREAKIARDAGGSSGQIAAARWAGVRQNAAQRNSRREQVRLEALGGSGTYNPGVGPYANKDSKKQKPKIGSNEKARVTIPPPPPPPPPPPKVNPKSNGNAYAAVTSAQLKQQKRKLKPPSRSDGSGTNKA